jgi:undecaprenyl-diphosphatase
MNVFDFILIGIIQGVFEWLPISSQGSLFIVFSNFFNTSPLLALDYSIFLHLGTVLSAVIYFRKDILKIVNIKSLKNLFIFKNKNKNENKNENIDDSTKILRFLFFAFVFTIIISLPIYLFLENHLDSVNLWFLNLIIALLLIISGILQLNKKIHKNKKSIFSFKNSIFLGLFQGISVLPGISRSGVTTSVLLLEKFTVEDSFKYSFLLSIPTVFAAQIYILLFSNIVFSYYVLISLVVSFIVGYITIDLLMKFSKNINFSYICFIIAFIYILLIFI